MVTSEGYAMITLWRKPTCNGFAYYQQFRKTLVPITREAAEAMVKAGEGFMRHGRAPRPPVTEAERLAAWQELRP